MTPGLPDTDGRRRLLVYCDGEVFTADAFWDPVVGHAWWPNAAGFALAKPGSLHMWRRSERRDIVGWLDDESVDDMLFTLGDMAAFSIASKWGVERKQVERAISHFVR